MKTPSLASGWSRRGLLGAAGALTAASFLPRTARAAGAAKRLVLVRAFGGWDTTFCMDPRLTVPGVIDGPDRVSTDEEIVSYGGLPIMASSLRPHVDAFFSDAASETVVVNGISVGSIVHEANRQRISTGSRLDTAADLACLSAVDLGGAETLPYLDLTGGGRVGPYAASAGALGRNNQILALLDRQLAFSAPDGAVFPRYTPSPSQATAIESYLQQQRSRFADRVGARAGLARFGNLSAAMERRQALQESTLLSDNLDFGTSGGISEQAELAAELMAMNFCHSASIDTGGGWDTHDDLGQQHALYDDLFDGLLTLVTALRAHGIWDETLVVVLSEMTRTPKMNGDGGKDHWPTTSALVLGGGLEGGRVLGGSSADSLDALPVNLEDGSLSSSSDTLITYGRFAAGVLHAAGVDVDRMLPGEEVLHGIVD